MGLFRRDDSPPRSAATARPAAPLSSPSNVTVIAAGSHCEGKLEGSVPIRVEGRFRGEIRTSAAVRILEGGLVEGEIKATQVTVAGELVGKVEVQGLVRITASGRVEGDVSGGRLVIEEGGTLEGQSATSTSGPDSRNSEEETT